MTATPATIAERPLTPGVHVSFAGILRSEWLKFRSLRSSIWTLLVAVVLIVGLAAAVGAAIANSPPTGDDLLTFHPASDPLAGVNFAIVAVGVLGVLSFSGEYKTGMIRSSVSAVPSRWPVVAGKAAVLALVTMPLMLVCTFVSFFLSQALLSQQHLNVSISDPHVLRTVIGAALTVVVGALIGLGIGLLLRHSAGAIVSFIGLFFIVPIIFTILEHEVADGFGTVRAYLPDAAGEALWSPGANDHALAPWAGFGVMCAWAAALLIAGSLRLLRTDV